MFSALITVWLQVRAHQPSLASRASARQARRRPVVAEPSKGCRARAFGEGGLPGTRATARRVNEINVLLNPVLRVPQRPAFAVAYSYLNGLGLMD